MLEHTGNAFNGAEAGTYKKNNIHRSCWKSDRKREGQLLSFDSYRKPQAKLVEEKSRSVETVEKEPPFAIIRSG